MEELVLEIGKYRMFNRGWSDWTYEVMPLRKGLIQNVLLDKVYREHRLHACGHTPKECGQRVRKIGLTNSKMYLPAQQNYAYGGLPIGIHNGNHDHALQIAVVTDEEIAQIYQTILEKSLSPLHDIFKNNG